MRRKKKISNYLIYAYMRATIEADSIERHLMLGQELCRLILSQSCADYLRTIEDDRFMI